MFPVLNLGPLALQVPSLALLLGVWGGITLAEKWAPYFDIDSNDISNLLFTAIITTVLGARLSYIAGHLDAFLSDPGSIFSLNTGLLDPVGGGAIGLILALIYGNRHEMPLWRSLDASTPFLATLIIALGLAHLASGDAYGAPTNLPWGIYLWGTRRHPTQIYEILAGILILGLIWPRRAGEADSPSRLAGETWGRFLALSAGAFLFIEGFRANSLTLLNGLRIVQFVAWVILAISLWGLGQLERQKRDQA